MSRTPCQFEATNDSCQANDIYKCTYCGQYQGNKCGKNLADQSMVTAYFCGNLVEERIPDALAAIKLGVVPFTQIEKGQ